MTLYIFAIFSGCCRETNYKNLNPKIKATHPKKDRWDFILLLLRDYLTQVVLVPGTLICVLIWVRVAAKAVMLMDSVTRAAVATIPIILHLLLCKTIEPLAKRLSSPNAFIWDLVFSVS